MKTWEYERLTFITKWNDALMERSIPTMFFPLTKEERGEYFKLMFSQGSTEEEQKMFSHFKEKIASAFEVFKDGVFLRNDRRSPKDSELFYEDGITPALTPEQAIAISLYSERTYMDMKSAIDNGHLPVLVVRKWMTFDKEREFRCFVKEAKLIGITQYYHFEHYGWIDQNQDEIQRRIVSFFEEIKADLLLLTDSLVFDVYVGEEGTLLIETNPYGLSDPCLCDYDELDELDQLAFRVKEYEEKKVDDLSEFLSALGFE